MSEEFFSGGMFHYKKDNPLYNVGSHAHLFVNEFGMFILSEFPKMQNMKSFAVNPDTDIDEFVREINVLQGGTEIFRFSKELFAYLETLVADDK